MREPWRTSNSSSQEESWRVCLLRTQDRASRPLGAGVLLPGGLVLTCAHTVLSRPGQDGARTPFDTVYVDGPGAALSGDGPGPLRARVLREYLVLPTPHLSGDLALLKLDHEPSVPHAVLHRQIPARNEPVHFTGYPEDLPGGEHLDARLMGRGGPAPKPEWVQLDTEGSSYVVRHGYSGSGVVHSRSRRLIGIVAHQFGTPQAPVRREHAYMIPTETVLKYLPLERLGLTVNGPRAVSRDVAVAPDRTASGRVPGLHRRLTRWLDGAADTDPVELAFAGEGEHALLHTVRSVLTLADREQSPPSASASSAGEPQVGSIDIAVDATNRTAEELAVHAADRIGLDDPPPSRTPHTELLDQIAEASPPLIAAFLAVDRSASPDAEIVALLRALLARGDSRLLLVFSDPRSTLLARVRAELLEPEWPDRRTDRLAARITRLAETEQRLRQLPGHPATSGRPTPRRPEDRSPRLRGRLQQLRRGGLLYDTPALPHELFRLAVDVETALLDAEAAELTLAGPLGPHEFVVDPPGDGLTDLPVVAVRDPDALVTAPPGPHLTGGDRLHQQYEVVGPIGQGSHGQVYLARDLLLDNRPVALKGILDPGNPAAVLQAHQERLRLVSLNHPSVIRVVNYARHPSTSAEFIVMEFADGAPLEWVATRIAQHRPPFSGPRVREFVVVYGLLILDALSYLHDQEGLVYGDLSLTNVLHCGNGIKLIDVAGVRKPGTPGPVSHRPPETGPAGEMTTAGDLYSVGAVLASLLAKAPAPPADLGTESLERALRRAWHTTPSGVTHPPRKWPSNCAVCCANCAPCGSARRPSSRPRSSTGPPPPWTVSSARPRRWTAGGQAARAAISSVRGCPTRPRSRWPCPCPSRTSGTPTGRSCSALRTPTRQVCSSSATSGWPPPSCICCAAGSIWNSPATRRARGLHQRWPEQVAGAGTGNCSPPRWSSTGPAGCSASARTTTGGSTGTGGSPSLPTAARTRPWPASTRCTTPFRASTRRSSPSATATKSWRT